MQGRYVGESDWGLEANPVNFGGMALRIATAEAIRVHPFLRALYADRLGPARDAPALVGPEEGRAVRSALSEWSLALLEPLLELGGCDLDAPGGVFERTALHLALMHTNLPAALALVRAGARLDVPDVAGNTALHYAARSGLPTAPLLEAAGLSATGVARAQSQRSQAGLLPSEMGAPPSPSAPKLLITPIFPEFSRFFPVFPGTSGRVLWIPGVQTEKMGEKWGKMGKKWVKNEITGVQKTVLMHALAGPGATTRCPSRTRG